MKKIENVILDRDGTIIEDKHYLSDPEGVELLSGAGAALGRLAQAGIRLFIATNQSGIGRGYYSKEDFDKVQSRLSELTAPHGVQFDFSAHCPHAPDQQCDCRKPKAGMWRQINEHAGPISPGATVMIGDKAADIGMGRQAGLALSILVLTGYGREQLEKEGQPPFAHDEHIRVIRDEEHDTPFIIARDLAAAADWIVTRNDMLAKDEG